MREVRIHASRAYTVGIEAGLLNRVGTLLRPLTRAQKACIVSGERVDALYGDRLEQSLQAAGFTVLRWRHPSGERYKNLETYGRLLNFLAESGLGRGDVLLSLGGGVTGDLTGFAAATYQRGMDYVQVPTSLLAMVDSSVGGKTAVDLPVGKNLCGSFWQPLAVFCDPALLATLPEEELRGGSAEVIKYAVLRDETLFDTLLGEPSAAASEEVIERCVSIKRDLVEEDEFDRGSRRLLNLGHSFGHAVELCSNYSVSHGYAVAIGLAGIARASAGMNVCSGQTAERIRDILRVFALPVETEIPREALLEALLRDKKRQGGDLPLILPEAIGRCRVERVPLQELGQWLRLGGFA